jgi:protein-S-isoprenylcysteine O-methyltransferase Ste14
LLIWTLLYAIAPLLEKPWLEREFGADYLEYKTKTLRFLVF